MIVTRGLSTTVRAVASIAAAAAVFRSPVLAQAPRPVGDPADRLPATRLEATMSEAFRLDGLAAEAFWGDAPVLTGLRQREPSEGAAASERTEVRVAYDDEALYVAVSAFDSEPDRVVARILQRDRLMEPEPFLGGLVFGGDDAVAILLDPFHDHRNGVVFATNPNGAEFEALISNEGGEVNVDWRGVWSVASQRTDFGWSAEFRIPWRTLRYPDSADGAEWGFNVYRIIRRKNEEVLWRAWGREGEGFHRVGRAGHLDGLTSLPQQGLNAELKPFVLAGGTQERDDFGDLDSGGELDGGLDLKAEVRPGLVLDLTVNTDFAQVEVDDEQVNLTRFDLFFPEKRDFFLENSGIFDFGTGQGDPFEPPAFVLFFSRRIGIHDDGPVPIRGGARLTGRVGRQTLGFLTVRTGSAFGQDEESFSVARVKRDVGDSGYLGAMITDRRGAEPANSVVGVDAQMRPAEGWTLESFLARTMTEGLGGDDYAYQVRGTYQGDRWTAFITHLGIYPEAQAGAGFVLREDVRRSEAFGGHTWREVSDRLRSVSLWGGGRYQTNMDGELQDWYTGPAISAELESGDEITVWANQAETVVDEEFDLTDDVIVPVGRYDASNIGWFGSTASSRPFYLTGSGLVSRFYEGSLVSANVTLNVAPSPQVALALGYQRNDVSVPYGAFTADVMSLRGSYAFSTRLTTNALIQYNALDDEISANVRLNFIHRPGSDLFLVFTERRGDDDRLWSLSDRGMVMKVTYLLRM